MAAQQRRTLSVSAVKHPSARVLAALNQDAMSNTDNIVLDHIVELFIPTQCGVCKQPLPEDLRATLLKDMKGRFFDAFCGFSVTPILGGYKMPDGSLAEEPIDVVWANTSEQRLAEHKEDVSLWAVEVADRLSQESVALRIDKGMAFFPRSNPKAPCAHKTAGKVTATAAAMQAAVESAAPPRDIDRLYAIQSILSRFGSLSDARALFCGTLGYTYADSQLPAAKWPDALRQMLYGQPQVIADTNGFRIVYLRLNADRLLRTAERAVINRILRDDPSFHGLFVISNAPQAQWRLVNSRQEAKDSTRFLLRRLPVGAGSGVRTATERLSLTDLENRPNLAAPAIQELHDQAFDVESVTRQFFLEIANWYFWALRHARFPEHAPKEADGLDHISVIRLITRLIFCWFVKEKGLIPDDLFDQRKLENTLAGFAPDKASNKDSVFYRAILQNLFFATLNTEMDKRGWVKDEQHFMAHSLYRHRDCFQKPNEALGLFKSIPFLNGGLFECLDKDLGEGSRPRYIRIDGFSRREDSQPTVPDFLFFGPECEVNLSEDYGDERYKKVPVRGLIHTLRRYNFTIEENTPLDQDVALDPELSGKVFENLLAAYNPETGATARKQTGSFYTPRKIVDYMVDETLIAYFKTKLEVAAPAAKDVEARLRHLFAYNDEPHRFSPAEVDILIAAIDDLKALDPAVGSGAFPMGILHKLVFILGKLDPRNEKWNERQIQRVRDAMATAERIEDATIRESSLRELEQQIANIKEAFEHNELDYGRKLYLIENCIYGVDIQTIAVQIAKMRFFISLIVDQKMDDTKPNRGVRPLPNLETKFVAANTLIGVNRTGQQLLRNREIEAKEAELRRVRERHFMARTLASKAKCRVQDAKLRAEIAELLKNDGWDTATARGLASWDPYDQNASAGFFDPEWMFGILSGFDVITGNPPYGFHQIHSPEAKEYFKQHYVAAQGSFEHYFLFYEAALRLLGQSAQLAFIAPVTWLTIPSAKSLRQFVLANYSVAEICWLSEQAFESASVNTLISLITTESPSITRVRIFDLLARFPNEPKTQRDIPQKRFVDAGHYISIFSGAEDNSILEKIRRVSKPLKEFARPCSGYNPYEVGSGEAPGGGPHTEETVREKPYHSNTKRGSQWKPEIIGRDLRRYHVQFSGARWVKYGPWLSAPRDANNFKGRRILVQEITGGKEMRLVAAYCEGELYHSRDVIPIKLEKPKPVPLYLLAVINSWLLSWYHQKCNPKAQKGLFPKVLVSDLNNLPIFPASDSDQDAIATLARKIVDAKQRNPAADTTSLEREIDLQVYALYGLTPEEIKIVEEAELALVPFFARRRYVSPRIKRLIESGKLGRQGTDSTLAISEDREDRT